MMFLFPHAAEIKDLSIQRTYSWTDLEEKIFYYSILNNSLDKVIVHVDQRFKTMGRFRFVDLLNLKLFRTYKKNFSKEVFQL